MNGRRYSCNLIITQVLNKTKTPDMYLKIQKIMINAVSTFTKTGIFTAAIRKPKQ